LACRNLVKLLVDRIYVQNVRQGVNVGIFGVQQGCCGLAEAALQRLGLLQRQYKLVVSTGSTRVVSGGSTVCIMEKDCLL
jgi:hypothetical protein